MTERNAVRQYIQRAGSGVTKVGLAATLALSMTPALAIAKEAGNENAQEAAALTATNNDATASEASKDAQTSSSSEQYNTNGVQAQSNDAQAQSNTSYDLAKIADGTYMGTAVASEPEGEEWGVSSYTVEVEVKVSSHAITSVKVADKTYDSLDVDNADYLDKAENGKRNAKGVAAQIVEKNATNVDVVSNATVSSNAIIEAVDNALQAAYDEQNPVVDEYTYGYAGLTWAEYWAAEGVQAADSAETSSVLDSRGEADKGAFDVVTRATSNHGLHRGSFQCSDVIVTTEGVEITPSYYPNKTSFVDTSGKTWTIGNGKVSDGSNSYAIEGHEVTGIKYVPVKVKTSDLEAFKAQYSFVANGETIQGGFSEGVLVGYSGVVADVDADTNGLKEASLSGDSFSFGKAATGTDSGIKDQALKSVTNVTPTVVRTSEADTENADTFHTGSYGEFLRVDINGDGYGDLGANMQAVTWTYYGNDSTRTNALATFGTKFAADNWMHKSTGIQLGLTESARCQLPADTDGTGYWTITVHALGYEDYTYEFQATADNIKKVVEPVTEETKQKLQDLYDKAAALNKDDYTAESWEKSAIEAETEETKDLLAKEDLGESEASEQIAHLQDAIDALDAYVYGYAGLTWAEYWAAEDVQAAGSTETSDMLDSRDEADKGAFDVVTRATTNHGLHRGSYQCMATIKCTDGTEFQLATWADDGKSFTTTDGKTVEWSKGSMTCDGQSYTMKDYEVSGLKYVPVKIAASQLDAFTQNYQFVANGGTLAGGYSEKNLVAYSSTADVDATTNGLKAVTVGEDGNFAFSAAAAGNGSGIEGQTQKTADLSAMGPVVKDGSGTYGEFLRVDFTENYGDLGANMQAVTWTYYGNDSTRTNALATFGTKFAADNWMHKSTGIQLGLTESARCQLPADTDGTGYWTITVRALGYADASYDFEATASNIADHTLVTDATKAELQKLVDKANDTLNNINEELYTEKSVSDLKTELAETVEMLAKSNLEESEAAEQKTHLSEAIEGLTLAPVTEETAQKLNDLISKAEELTESDYSNVSWQTLMLYLGQAKQHAASADLTEQDARSQINVLEIAIDGLEANPRIALNEAIEAASALQQDNFTKASWEPFASALAAAQAAVADSDMSDDEISLAYQALVDAQDALAKAATADDRSCLADEIAKADSLKESDYTAESWKAYQEALAAAKKAAAAEDPSSAELQEATDNLAAARAALAKPAAEASTASNDQSKATTLAQTSDAAATFAVATGFAAFVAAVAGAFAIARRRLFSK